MTPLNDVARLRRFGNVALWVAIGATLVDLVLDLASGWYDRVGLDCTVVAGLLAALRVSRALDQWFDARLTKARLDAELARLTYETVLQQLKAGQVHVDVGLSPALKH
jgi:hypothetical protein